jgi:hypothetical protein
MQRQRQARSKRRNCEVESSKVGEEEDTTNQEDNDAHMKSQHSTRGRAGATTDTASELLSVGPRCLEDLGQGKGNADLGGAFLSDALTEEER